MVCLGIVYPIFIIIQFRSIKKSLVNRFLNTDFPKTVEFPVRMEYYMDVFLFGIPLVLDTENLVRRFPKLFVQFLSYTLLDFRISSSVSSPYCVFSLSWI